MILLLFALVNSTELHTKGLTGLRGPSAGPLGAANVTRRRQYGLHFEIEQALNSSQRLCCKNSGYSATREFGHSATDWQGSRRPSQTPLRGSGFDCASPPSLGPVLAPFVAASAPRSPVPSARPSGTPKTPVPAAPAAS